MVKDRKLEYAISAERVEEVTIEAFDRTLGLGPIIGPTREQRAIIMAWRQLIVEDKTLCQRAADKVGPYRGRSKSPDEDDKDTATVEGEVVGLDFWPTFADQVTLLVEAGGKEPTPGQLYFREKNTITIDGVKADRKGVIDWLASFGNGRKEYPHVKITIHGLTKYVPVVEAEFTTKKE